MWVSTALRQSDELNENLAEWLFQSRCGFLPHRDPSSSRRSPARSDVSIPVWVSTASRRVYHDHGPVTLTEFQSRCGFLPHRDGTCCAGEPVACKFQSRCGFLPHRDPRVATLGTDLRRVSIPVWVSTASRRSRTLQPSRRSSCFNPGVGFYRIATVSSSGRSSALVGFNPGVGFYRIATRLVLLTTLALEYLFQSRCGFLPHRDHDLTQRLVRVRHVSIPVWVSTASRPAGDRVWTPRRVVSIPVWVSTASRQLKNENRMPLELSFNPGVGFYRIATCQHGYLGIP